MIFLAEFFVSLIRINLLIFTTILSYLLGKALYTTINSTLFAFNTPCMEIITLLLANIPSLFLLYGVHAKKYFWQRENHYNLIVFLLSFCIGALVVFSPLSFVPFLGSSNLVCDVSSNPASKAGLILSTGFITALLAFVGFDMGVLVKHISLSIIFSHPKKLKKKPRR